MAPKVWAMAPASIRAMTGTLKRMAMSAAEGSPSKRPMTPSIRIRSESAAARARRQRASASPHMPRSRFWQGRPDAKAWICGSRKSGPHLKTVTRRPWRACRRARAAVTVVLPWPEAGAAMSRAGQAGMVIGNEAKAGMIVVLRSEADAQSEAQGAWFERMEQAAVDGGTGTAAPGTADCFAVGAGAAPVFDIAGLLVEQVENVERDLQLRCDAVAGLEVGHPEGVRFFATGFFQCIAADVAQAQAAEPAAAAVGGYAQRAGERDGVGHLAAAVVRVGVDEASLRPLRKVGKRIKLC